MLFHSTRKARRESVHGLKGSCGANSYHPTIPFVHAKSITIGTSVGCFRADEPLANRSDDNGQNKHRRWMGRFVHVSAQIRVPAE